MIRIGLMVTGNTEATLWQPCAFTACTEIVALAAAFQLTVISVVPWPLTIVP